MSTETLEARPRWNNFPKLFWRVLPAGIMVLVSQWGICQSSANIDDDLRHSEICARAANNFRSQPEWKSEPADFTSHFNKKLGKCLVKVTTSHIVSGNVLEMQHVYDAMEGTVLGGEIITKTIPRHDGEQKTLHIAMVRDGKTLGNKNADEAREAYQWFETLMKE
jgi:hypothetical protein